VNCADVEILLADYVDGTLRAEERFALEAHLAGCAVCAELARDASAAVAFMELTRRLWPEWEGECELRQMWGPEDFAPPKE